MHSALYTALARAADDHGRTVEGFIEIPFSGTEDWIADRMTTVVVLLNVPEYEKKGEPSFYVTKCYLVAPEFVETYEPAYPSRVRITWDTSETARLSRRDALVEFSFKGLRA